MMRQSEVYVTRPGASSASLIAGAVVEALELAAEIELVAPTWHAIAR
jgi:hypothetical protein